MELDERELDREFHEREDKNVESQKERVGNGSWEIERILGLMRGSW